MSRAKSQEARVKRQEARGKNQEPRNKKQENSTGGWGLAIGGLEALSVFWYLSTVHNFRSLAVWQRSYRLSLELIDAVGRFTGPARYALGDQIVRSSMSIPSNIAEGTGRMSDREFNRFLAIALGSAHELETQIMLATDLGLLSVDESPPYLQEVSEIQRMIYGLRQRSRPD